MQKTLGIDLGSNSLGWAILDDVAGDILDKGVVVFPEGVDLSAGTSVETPAAVRRAARMGRRMKFRRKMRKWNLLKILIGAKMCPLSHSELDAWKKDGKYPVGNKDFLHWLKSTDTSNPYCDRAAAAQGKVSPFILGRALYHIAQRRGFKSSRKDEAAQIDAETGELKAPNKEMGAVKSSISELSKAIASSGCQTLGQYFFKILDGQRHSLSKSRIRARYTGRIEHYEFEFAAIMDAQGYPRDNQLRQDLYKAIFMQRPLRSQKHLVGKCPLEKGNARAQIGHPAFEEFRMLSFVNNLSLEDTDGEYKDENGNLLYPLTKKDRELICSAFMKSANSIKFGAISKLFKKDVRFKEQNLKFHYYRDDDIIPTCPTRHKIKEAFGDILYDEQKVFDALTFFDDTNKLQDWFRKHFPALDSAAILRLSAIHPKEGNANYSLKAINRILPFLRKGYELSQARFMAKLVDVIPDYAENEDEILRNLQERLWAYREEKRRYGDLDSKTRKITPVPTPLIERYKEYLSSRWGVDEIKWRKLYLYGDEKYEPLIVKRPNGEMVKRLPAVKLGMIRNPLVQRAMTTLRRLVNYLGEHGKIATDDTIRIELARSVNDFATRKAWQNWQNSRRKLRGEAQAEIEQLGITATEDAIDRYVLWKEQDRKCLYTGKNINISELFAGNLFDVEHTIPRSLSGDDSLANKTICEAVYNRQVKMGRIPRDCPNWDEIDIFLKPWKETVERLEKDYRNQLRSAQRKTDPAQRSLARVKALTTRFELRYWRDKLKRFELTADRLQSASDGLGGFKKRQLVDTGIMCTHAVELLKSVYPATFSVNGTATAFARKAWGIQTDEAKDRTEHTHHAKDAMVIAALTPSRFMAICSALKDDGSMHRRECDVCPPPYEGFAEKVRKACDEILVKHVLRQTTLRQSSKLNALAHAHKEKGDPNGKTIKFVKSQGDTVRGQLHRETYYGRIVDPISGCVCTVQRAKIDGEAIVAVKKMLPNIIDPAIQKIVEAGLEKLLFKGEAIVIPGSITMPSGVPIRKIRIKVPFVKNPIKIKTHRFSSKAEYKNFLYAATAENSYFRLALYRDNENYRVLPDNSLAWAQSHKKASFIPHEQRQGFVGFIYKNAMAIALLSPDELVNALTNAELRRRLYTIISVGGDGDCRAQFKLATAAGMKKDLGNIASNYSLDEPPALLRMPPSKFLSHMLFEGIHFKMMLDGSIHFINRKV